MEVSSTNDIAMKTIQEAICGEHLDSILLNNNKPIGNIRKRPKRSIICNYLSKLSNSELTGKRS